MNIKNKILENIAISCIAVGCFVGLIFCFRLASYYRPFKGLIDMPTSGQVGDFVGGIIGTFFGLSGTILIYIAYRNQKEELAATQNLLKNQEMNQFMDLWISIYHQFSNNAVMKLKDNTEAKGLLQITSQFKKLNQVAADFYARNISNRKELIDLLTQSYIEAIKNSPDNHPLLKQWIYLINSAIKRIKYAEEQKIYVDSYLEIICSIITWDEMELLRNFTNVSGASHEAHINDTVKTTFNYFSAKYNEITRPSVFLS